jgi:hypothetical protein
VIEFLNRRPKGFMPYLHDSCTFFAVKHEGERVAIGVIEPCDGRAFIDMGEGVVSIHMTVTKWSHSIFKTLLKDWEGAVQVLKARGVRKLIATGSNGYDKKWFKFASRFGFPWPSERGLQMGTVCYIAQDLRDAGCESYPLKRR